MSIATTTQGGSRIEVQRVRDPIKRRTIDSVNYSLLPSLLGLTLLDVLLKAQGSSTKQK